LTVCSCQFSVSHDRGAKWRHIRVCWSGRRRTSFSLDVSQVTRAFPPDERFALTGQLRRAALSVPTNIVEGQAFGSTPVFLRHLAIACGSLAETRYLLQVAYELQ